MAVPAVKLNDCGSVYLFHGTYSTDMTDVNLWTVAWQQDIRHSLKHVNTIW